MEKLKENQIYTGTVEGYSSEGLGIVRINGAVVFLPQAIRGEEVDVKITKVMREFICSTEKYLVLNLDDAAEKYINSAINEGRITLA